MNILHHGNVAISFRPDFSRPSAPKCDDDDEVGLCGERPKSSGLLTKCNVLPLSKILMN